MKEKTMFGDMHDFYQTFDDYVQHLYHSYIEVMNFLENQEELVLVEKSISSSELKLLCEIVILRIMRMNELEEIIISGYCVRKVNGKLVGQDEVIQEEINSLVPEIKNNYKYIED